MTPTRRNDAKTTAQRHRTYLANWLREWEIDRILDAETSCAGNATAIPGGPAHNGTHSPRRPAPDVGQIRLLHPRHLPISAGPLYVALLARRSSGAFTAAPFSRFSVPACDHELLTGRDAPCLRVLSVGVSRPLPARLLTAGWNVDRLQTAELQDAIEVFHYAFDGVQLSDRLRARVGPPVLHPDDPRHLYGDQLAEGMDALWLCRPPAHPEREGSGYDVSAEQRELPLAAEPRAAYGSHRLLRIENTDLFLEASTERTGTRVLTVIDPHGKASRALDGSVLLCPDGQTSPPVRHAGLRWDVPADLTACCLQRSDGRCLLLSPA